MEAFNVKLVQVLELCVVVEKKHIAENVTVLLTHASYLIEIIQQ